MKCGARIPGCGPVGSDPMRRASRCKGTPGVSARAVIDEASQWSSSSHTAETAFAQSPKMEQAVWGRQQCRPHFRLGSSQTAGTIAHQAQHLRQEGALPIRGRGVSGSPACRHPAQNLPL